MGFAVTGRNYPSMDRLSWSAMACRKSSVFRYMLSVTFAIPCMQMAKSLVISPASTVSTQAFSSATANRSNSGVPSSFARCSKPLVQA